MPSSPSPGATVGTESMGSHFVVTTVPGDGLAGAMATLPHVLRDPIREPHTWSAPAVPVVARAVRALVAMHPWIDVDAEAERLLTTVEALPEAATAVAHFCEHKPGVPGVVIAMEPDPELRAALGRLPDRRHDPVLDRFWVPAREPALEALGDELDRLGALTATPEVRRRVGRYEQPSLSTAAVVDVAHRCDVAVVENAAGEVGLRLCRRCHPDLEPALAPLGLVTKSFDSWWVSIHGDGGLRALLEARPELRGDGGDAVLAALDAAAAVAGTADALEALSSAEEGRVEVDGLTAPLRPFQGAAVDYALRARRTFLSDEPGLGKTIQALATLEAAGAYPALIVAPASLRINWLREAERWLPHRTRAGLSGGDAVGTCDISVASYEITHTLVDGATARPPRALVLDESHFCKTPTARRTQAVTAIADALDEDAIVLLLSGTPVLNRPEELAPQLKILGRLEEIGGARRFARVYARGQELNTLNRRLRRTCFVRRRKADVLRHLPAKQRVIVPVAIANGGEYRAAQADVARWVRAQAEADEAFQREIAGLDDDARAAAIRERGRDAEQRARRAQALVRITQLALMAARGKLDGAREWIANFVETGEKLVVFTRHREIGDALLASFPDAACATGRLDADGRAAEVQRFQADDACRLIVCSLDAAGVGLTMTAASNVAFVELGWTPAAHDQAEDRVHRIGQEEAVTAWYLLAADTIDERIAAVIERKRELIRAATDGAVGDQDAVLDELLDWLSADDAAR
ncbi:MAG TPA: DEAD/DEAH box helicase [Baekduia sp.]|uniref:DEAD/DEAH box helicase n=1 Tax=Baekduia sp. TaxID=2600305 RepID=UPI002D7A2A9B|nr:DEAD/DEAH box helicase [Baekduia sp.]HET6508016.1 DEAD/DEAH box helicase [Baekduia sp.]